MGVVEQVLLRLEASLGVAIAGVQSLCQAMYFDLICPRFWGSVVDNVRRPFSSLSCIYCC